MSIPELRTLHECLQELPPDMRLRSMASNDWDLDVRTASEWLQTPDSEGYWISDQRSQYGRASPVGLVTRGMTVFRQHAP